MGNFLQSFSGDRLLHTVEKIENIFVIRVIRNGMITMLPLLLLGSFALVLLTFPNEAYTGFIREAAGGFFYNFFHMVYQATFGVIAFYMVICFSMSFFNLRAPEQPVTLWGIASALASFMILTGVWSNSFFMGSLGGSSVFLAVFSTLASCEIFYLVSKRYTQAKSVYDYGADSRLGNSMGELVPAAVTVTLAALLAFLVTLTGYETIYRLLSASMVQLIKLLDDVFWQGLCYVFSSHLLWLFGIHGTDCLQDVANQCFAPLLLSNQLAVDMQMPAHEILARPFFKCFILMGGCGSTLSLVLAIILFSRNKGMRLIARVSSLPLFFNINELVVFGLPIVFSPTLALPFLLVPLLQYLITYGAMAAGLVPVITVDIPWTTPVLLNSYLCTGSLAGSVLQVLNILLGVAVYAPFVHLLGKVKAAQEDNNREDFVKWYIANESEIHQQQLLGLRGIYGDIAQRMAMELEQGLQGGRFELFYQPQYRYDGTCMGVEALMRWPDVKWLNVYPPLLVQLAKEQGLLLELEKKILQRGMEQREEVFAQFGRGIKISVNVTGNSAARQEYWDFLRQQWEAAPFKEGTLCIEVTEQDAIDFNAGILNEFRTCKELGIKFAIDDFSAGQTSLEYLKNGIFDMLKLDGALVKVVTTNERCQGIIASLVALSRSLQIDCLAEFVENEEIREKLHELGCDLYQGYLYSPAVRLEQKK